MMRRHVCVRVFDVYEWSGMSVKWTLIFRLVASWYVKCLLRHNGESEKWRVDKVGPIVRHASCLLNDASAPQVARPIIFVFSIS